MIGKFLSKQNNIAILGIGFLFILNLIFAIKVELTFDEAYYWIYSEYLSWGYFDHPPMVAWIIKLGTMIFGNTELGVRIVPNILACLGCYLLWVQTGKKNALAFLNLIFTLPLINFNGLFALPDIGLFFFGVMYFFSLEKYLQSDSIKNSMILGVVISLLFYSKYHGLLIVFLTIFAVPKLVFRKSFWVVAVVAFVSFLPHLYWQYINDFVSFKFHLTGRSEKHFDLSNIADYVGGQIALAGLFLFFLMLTNLKNIKSAVPFQRVLLFNSFGFYLFLLFVSFRNPVEANWTTTCAVALILLFTNQIPYKKLLIASSPILLLTFVLRGGMLFSLELRERVDVEVNRLFEVSGWKDDIIPTVKEICGENTWVADTYQHAAKFSFYIGKKVPALHYGSRTSQYELLALDKNLADETAVCYITTKKFLNSEEIETGLPDNLHVVSNVKFGDLKKYNEK